MRKILLAFFTVFTIAAQVVQAQTFTTANTSVTGNFIPGASTEYKLYNKITATGPNIGDSVALDWKIVSSDFPADWLENNVLGICDNALCSSNIGGGLWNGTSGSINNSNFYRVNEEGDFHLLFTPVPGVTSFGQHSITVNLKDANSSYNKNITFVVNYNWATGTSNVTKRDDNISLYPNPVRDQLNVVFTGVQGVKNIAIYNLIGRAISVYRVNGSSAGLNVESLPSGIYFVRLLDAQGGVLATRKFTRM